MEKRTRATNLKKYHEDYPYLSNTSMDARLLGTTLMSPGMEHNSSTRLAMLMAQIPQALNIFGGEKQRVFTGFDNQLSKYQFNDTKQPDDITIVAVIPKIQNVGSSSNIKSNPKTTVIYVDKHNTAGYFDVNSYEELSDGFGYETKRKNTHLLVPNNIIKKGTTFTEPPGHGELGCNAMIAMMRSIYTSEDSFAISESFAAKNQTYGVSKAFIELGKHQVPSNIMGDEDEYKFLLDIGEQVGDDGILCAIKTPKKDTILSELAEGATRPDHLHDLLYKVPPGATILDIDVYCDQKFHKNKAQYFDQLRKYLAQNKRYWTDIVQVYKRLKADRIKLTPTLHTLFTRALSFAPIHTKKQGHMQYKNKPIEFVHIEVTYSWIQSVQPGFKFTGTEGGKGTVCAILPDEYMPINEYGERADMLIDSITVLNRMNLGQNFVMFLNQSGAQIVRDINNGKIPNPYEYILKFLTMVNTNYAGLIRKRFDNNREEFVNMCVEEGIHINYPPYLNTFDTDTVLKIADEFNVKNTRVSFLTKKKDGTVVTTTTKNPIPMGMKYIMLLCKIPHVSSAGIGRVSQFLVPIKSNSADKTLKKRSAIRETAIKFGEDELRNLAMTIGVEATIRLLCVYGCTPEATFLLMETILNAEFPSNIPRINMTTAECIKKNKYIHIQKSLMGACGIMVE